MCPLLREPPTAFFLAKNKGPSQPQPRPAASCSEASRCRRGTRNPHDAGEGPAQMSPGWNIWAACCWQLVGAGTL